MVLSVVSLAVVAPAANADNSHGPKVDDRVALAASDATSTATPIPVIVFGKSISAKKDPMFAIKADVGLGYAGTVTPAQLDALAQQANVAYIAPDVAMAPLGKGGGNGSTSTTTSTDTTTTTTTPAVPVPMSFPDLATLYPLTDNAPSAWAQGYTGQGVGIAVIDSGIQENDDYGSSSSSRLKAITGYDRGDDNVGHGTIVSSIAAGASGDGRFVGIAPGANVLAYDVAGSNGTYTSDVLQALIWVISNQATYNIKVVNLSLAETTPSLASQDILDTFIDAIETYYGIEVVTSSGNLGPGSSVFAPGNDPFAITVGATDTNGTADGSDDTVTPWSSSGMTLDGVAKPDLLAPGRQIVGQLPYGTTLGKEAPEGNWVVPNAYASISGTSFSAPQVAGASAILFQEHPDWTPGQVKWVLENTAHPTADGQPELDIAAAAAYTGTPPSATDGLVPSDFGMSDWTSAILSGSSKPNGHAWGQTDWNSNSWNGNNWNSNSWNSNSWNSNSWNSNSWNDHGWDE